MCHVASPTPAPRQGTYQLRSGNGQQVPGNAPEDVGIVPGVISHRSSRHEQHRGSDLPQPRSAGTISNVELAERLPGKFLGVPGALGVSDRLCVLFSDPFAAPGAGSGGRHERHRDRHLPQLPSTGATSRCPTAREREGAHRAPRSARAAQRHGSFVEARGRVPSVVRTREHVPHVLPAVELPIRGKRPDHRAAVEALDLKPTPENQHLKTYT